ncbi:hypothetical protein BS17DRAFT_769616 [Gyrodon lividus]|nr:hypothetical protein BS17DRAFT_769616 [Gyrodon lividus]
MRPGTTPPAQPRNPEPQHEVPTPPFDHLPPRPTCMAKDRLLTWSPIKPRSTLDSKAILSKNNGIPEAERAPANPSIVAAFILALADSYSGSAVSNYVCGIKAWHTIHGLTWTLSDNETEALLQAASSLAPPRSKRPPRESYTIESPISIRNQLDLTTPLHAAVFACLTTAFYATARRYAPSTPCRTSNLQTYGWTDRQGNWITNLHLPKTKSAPDGEDINWARQEGSDPLSAFETHLAVNAPPVEGPLFAYRHGKKHQSLTKKKFLLVLASALKDAGKPPLQGHGIRIGSTLEYLLRNIPFDVVKVKGRWGSDAFLVYLRRHTQILAPYMQAQPVLHESFLRITLPPVR